MIMTYTSSGFCDSVSLEQAICLKECENPVVSVVGAGGKTSTIWRLMEEYRKTGRKVIVTTTTHMMEEPVPWMLKEPSVEKALCILERYGCLLSGIPAANGKITQVPSGFFHWLLRQNIPVLIEADGARRLPLKVPGEQEPVIVPETTHVLSLYGLDAVGKKLEEVCFRAKEAAGFLKKSVHDVVSVQDIAALAASGQGGKKGCPSGTAYTVVLNKADDGRRISYAWDICRMLEQNQIRCVVSSGKR